MNYYERASVLGAETVEHRRFFHTNAEVGLYMPKAKAYVMAKLKEYGLEPKECGEGVTAETLWLSCRFLSGNLSQKILTAGLDF